MKHSNIAVMGGTYIDTKLGVNLIKTLTKNFISIPISTTPEEQTRFQTMDNMYRFQKIKSVLSQYSQYNDIICLLVYCNSLSSTTDFQRLSKECGINIITPLPFYSEIAKCYTSFGVISANAQGSAGIEKSILDSNTNAKIYSISNLEWVKAIEDSVSPKKIYEKLGLQETIGVYEKLQVDCIVLGCTHFPYFEAYLQEHTKIPCISSDQYLLSQLKQYI